MAAKGAVSKESITLQILDLFPNAFINEKEIRIPMVEDGAEVQIKCVLTCAKVNVAAGADSAVPGVETPAFSGVPFQKTEPVQVEATEEEKNAVSNLMAELNLEF